MSEREVIICELNGTLRLLTEAFKATGDRYRKTELCHEIRYVAATIRKLAEGVGK